MNGKRLGVLLLAMILGSLYSTSVSAVAIAQPLEFETEAQQRQYQKLIRELRCTVCQSESIYESNAPLAADVRRRVYEMTLDGASEEEIIDFMVQRYGDYVRFRPPLQANTLLLWTSPIILFVVGGLIWWQVVRSRRQLDDRPPLTDEERETLERMRRGE